MKDSIHKALQAAKSALTAPTALGEHLDPFGIFQSLAAVQQAWLTAPEAWMAALNEFWDNYCHICADLGDHNTQTHSHELHLPVHDSRFTDPSWNEHPFFHAIKQQYQLWERWLDHTVRKSPTIDEHTRNKATFWIKQYTHMLSPANFFFLNPEAISKALVTQGQSVLLGQELLFKDIMNKEISMVTKKFTVGLDLATTPGKVIYRNPLLELIYYTPMTEQVAKMPLLFVPPWVNKFYILDLKPEKSMVQYLLNQGFSVFMISWKNPNADMRDVTFEDYLFKGILSAIEVVKEICGVAALHAIGYCIGGTALTALMAWLNGHPEYQDQNPIAHATLLCSLSDFSNPGDIKVFIDETSIQFLEKLADQQGVLEGKQMEMVFRLLRSNSLIWYYFTKQYLMGEAPPAFDVLFWNTDGTRLPAAMYKYYIRELYLHNNLVKKNALSFRNLPIDFGRIVQPLYILGTEIDHITPWKSVFSLSIFCPNAEIRGVLAGSGHIVGVLTPPSDPPKRYHRAGSLGPNDTNLDEWLHRQSKVEGSWWPDWASWLGEHCGPSVHPPARDAFANYPMLMPAPGKYVQE